ncbi:MAG: hypothetical protein IJU54_02075 [Alphaproteobacteria bacterium]|nr:hypothetical protein [Alphaproteobacteria bacterium]
MNIILKSLQIFSVFCPSITYCYSTSNIDDEYDGLGPNSNYSVSFSDSNQISYNNIDKTNSKRNKYYEELEHTISCTNESSENNNNDSINNLMMSVKTINIDNHNDINYNNHQLKEKLIDNNLLLNNQNTINNKDSNESSNTISAYTSYPGNDDNKCTSAENNINIIEHKTHSDIVIRSLDSIAQYQDNNQSAKDKSKEKDETNKHNNDKYFCGKLNKEQYEVVTKFTNDIFEKFNTSDYKFTTFNKITLDSNPSMNYLKDILNSITTNISNLKNSLKNLENMIPHSNLRNAHLIQDNFNIMSKIIDNICNLHCSEILHTIFFSRMLSIDIMAKRDEYNKNTFTFIDANPNFSEILSEIKRQLPSDYQELLNKINAVKINDIFDYYTNICNSYIRELETNFKKNEKNTYPEDINMLGTEKGIDNVLNSLDKVKTELKNLLPKKLAEYRLNVFYQDKTIGDFMKNE